MCHSKHSLFALGAVLVILQLSAKTVDGRVDPKNECLTDLQISTNTSSTSLRIDWSYQCQDVKEFKIYWKQTRYLACDQDIDENQQEQNTKTTQDHLIILDGLLPYSQYSVEVKAIKIKRSRPVSVKGVGTTLGALPEVRLKKDTRAKNNDLATDASITFSWSAPTDCTGYNGELGGYYYELIGDHMPQGGSSVQNGYLSLDQTQVEIEDLEPFVNYQLAVYVTDVDQKKSNNPLILSQTTLSTTPPAPTDLAASVNNYEYFVSWKAPDPPRGELDYYVLRWKEEQSSDWMSSEKLPHKTSCPETDCSYTADNLDITKNFTFQISAYNLGVTDTDPTWSQAFYHIAASPGQSWSSGIITIIALVIVVCLLLLVIVLIVVIWKCRSRRNKSFEGILQYDPDKPSPFDRDDHTRATTITTRTELSDYSVGVPQIQENGTKTEPYKIVDIVFPDQDTHRRSFHDPLPLRPGEEESIYSELHEKDEDGEEVYLAPRVASEESLDDDGYLRPNYKPPKDDLDQSDEEYLKPNFNRLPRIDTLDRSPDRDFRPVIPITSYGSNDGLAMDDIKTKNPRVLQSAV